MPIDPEQWLPRNDAPVFHVRYIQDGVEQEQIFVGKPDGKGNFNVDVPTPCTLLSVKQHGFPWCDVCDGGPTRRLGIEREPETDIADSRDISTSFDVPLTPEVRAFYEHAFGAGSDREQLIRAEVEATDWPGLFEDYTLRKVIDG